MEELSTSNLISLETELWACNFEDNYATRGQIESYAYIRIWSYS